MFAIAIVVGACTATLPDKPVDVLSNSELLLAYGYSVRNALGDSSKEADLDRQVQARKLLSPAEVIKIKQAQVYEGMTANAVLASFGAPEFVENAPSGGQIWHYPYDTRNYGRVFLLEGRLFGYNIATAREGPSGMLRWTNGGSQFQGGGDLVRCRAFADSHAISLSCPAIAV